MPKWKNKSKEDKETIKKEYLKFYNNFNANMCPYLNYREKHSYKETERLFTDEAGCSMCSEFETLKVDKRYSGSCPCIEHGPYEANKLLKKLLIKWKLIKSEGGKKKHG
jgi:hypothetical protein